MLALRRSQVLEYLLLFPHERNNIWGCRGMNTFYRRSNTLSPWLNVRVSLLLFIFIHLMCSQ